MANGRVLSIQSHVVHGYVGNRAAVFPLQLLDFEVDFVNSVQFSNHVGYRHLRGDRFSSEQLSQLYDGLKLNRLTVDYTHLLTGYVGNETFLNQIADIVDDLKATNPRLIYLCDPVLGDNDQWYVPESLLDIYVKRLLPKADIITPNIFELEKIYGKKMTSLADLFAAVRFCHCLGVRQVVVSSVQPFDEAKAVTHLHLYASSADDQRMIRIEFDRLAGHFCGTGDTFAAMLLAWLVKLNGDLKSACEYATSAMLHILNKTIAISNQMRGQSSSESAYSDEVNLVELKLIQSKRDIEAPTLIVTAQLIDLEKN